MSANRPAQTRQLVDLCAAEDVTAATPVRVVHDDMVYAVFRCEGGLYVTQDQCTHGPGSLSEGFVFGCEVECPFHQGRFDIRSGRPTGAPCTEGLQTWTVHELDGRLYIDPSEERPVESE